MREEVREAILPLLAGLQHASLSVQTGILDAFTFLASLEVR